MNNNIISQISTMIKAGRSPRDAALVLSQLPQFKNNQIFQQLVQYAEQGREDKLEEFGRNYAKEHNIDFDGEINGLKSLIGFFH